MAKEKSLRSQFKATSIKSLRKTVDKDDAMVGVQNNDYLNLEDGKSVKIRIFPAHPGEENFYVSRMCYWLSFVNSDGETKRGTVLDSIAHGGTKMDLVREYVKFAKKKFGNDSSKMEALIGTRMSSNSLNPQYSWLCYADTVRDGEELKPKVWEFKKKVRDLLNKLAFSEDEDEPIEVDPFTDPDEGLPVIVKYLKNPNKKKGEQYYEVSFAKKTVARPLSDEELEHFAAIKPLSELIPAYTMRDFDRALEGLQNFDDENEFDLFNDDDWLDIVEKVKSQYDGEDSDDDDEKPAKKKTDAKKSSKKVAEEEEDEAEETTSEDSDDDDDDSEEDETDNEDDSSDEYDEMDRSELKKLIKTEGLDITVKKSMSDDDIREAIREALKDEDSDDDGEDSDDDSEEEEEPKSKIGLDEIRKKLAGKK